jgi:hypothetical protein
MIQISGPESVDIVKIGDVHIFLFGDVHNEKKGLCKPCKNNNNCYYITDFINSLTLQPIELFLESPWLPNDYEKKYINYASKYKSVLSNVNDNYFSQMYLHTKPNSKLDSLFQYFKKTKKVTTITRVHYTDIRTRKEFSTLYKMKNVFFTPNMKESNEHFMIIYLHIIITFFPSCKHFKRFVDIMFLSDNYIADIKDFFNNDEFFYNLFSVSEKVNKVRKQFLKILNPQWKTALLKYYNYRCNFYFNNKKTSGMFRHTCKQYDKLISTSWSNTPFNESMFIIFTMLLHWEALMMDMYHLARMLYYIEKGDSSVFVSYTGLAHTQFYKTFFTKYLKGKVLFSCVADTNRKKCLSIPENVISNFMPIK